MGGQRSANPQMADGACPLRRRVLAGLIALPGLCALARPADAQPASPAGFWRAEDIKGGGVLDTVESRLDIFPDGRIGGSAGCNLIAGRATISAGRIAIGPLRSTRMACPPGVNAQEQRFLAALAEVRGWRVDTARRKLFLLAADGTPVLRFAAL